MVKQFKEPVQRINCVVRGARAKTVQEYCIKCGHVPFVLVYVSNARVEGEYLECSYCRHERTQKKRFGKNWRKNK